MRSAGGFLPSHSPSGLGPKSANGPYMSADARFLVLGSGARNLEPSPTSGTNNLYLFDRVSAEFRLITHAIADPLLGTNADPEAASISGDGRYVAYLSAALLAPNASYGTNCYLWDRLTGLNTSLSGDCYDITMSADGRRIAYVTGGSIQLLDRVTSVAQLVSRRSGTVGTPASGASWAPAISADGRWVTFESTAGDLTSPSTTGGQVFLFDAQSGTNVLVSHKVGAPDVGGDSASSNASISADGSSIAFVSRSMDLVAGQIDQATTDDVFLYDRNTGANRLVSHAFAAPTTAAGVVPQGVTLTTGQPLLSDDGRFAAFVSDGSNLASGQVGPGPSGISSQNAFLYDRLTDESTLVTHAPSASAVTSGGIYLEVAGLGADGSSVLITCDFCSLVAGQVNTQPGWPFNVFLHDRASGENAIVSRAANSPAQAGNQGSGPASLSRSGTMALFESNATDLVSGDLNQVPDVFLYSSTVSPPPGSHSFFIVPPCRLVDTRLPSGDWGGPALGADYDRSFVATGRCGIPPSAKAISLNVTVTEPTAPGDLRLFPAGAAALASTINYARGQTRGNNAIVFLGPIGELTVRSDQSSGRVHLILDVNGYFE